MHFKMFLYNMRYLVSICLFAVSFLAASTWAEEVSSPQGETQKSDTANVLSKFDVDDFEYQLEGRPDPFEPFIKPQVATTLEKDEIVEDEVVLTGMQLFEPGQLKLVAVMFAEGNNMAMVEDVTGKGYVVNEGVLIGRHGVVSQITPDRVIITETAKTRAGKELITTVVMRLNE